MLFSKASVGAFSILAASFLLAGCGDGAPENGAAGSGNAARSSGALEDQITLGRRYFSPCAACHTSTEGGPARVGPNLFGVYGRGIAEADGFAYSTAFRNSDLVWTEKNLDGFIANPKSFVPGTRMTFAGIPQEDRREAIIAYLATLKNAPD